MDGYLNLFARPRGNAPHRLALRRLGLMTAAAGMALALSGCDVQRVNALEERVTAVEAKAEAAEKRAKAAESLASQTQPIVQPEPAPPTDLDANADEGGYEPVNEGDGPGEPPPMADNGKG